MSKIRLYVVPHTHYDAEVFITRDATLRLGADNLLDVLYLLDRQPEFRFVLDQRCYAEGFEQLHPEQMAAVRRFAGSGRLEIAGGMHVMPDANLPSGESLVRQILYGRAYLDALSGSRSTIGWMLDSFGHHPQMPQIMRLGGFDTYIFQRGVAEFDRPSAFWWKGIDGSKIRAEWLPHTYALLYQVPGNLPAFAEALGHIRQTIEPYIYNDQYMVMSGADLNAPPAGLAEMVDRFNAAQDELELVIATASEYFQAQPATGLQEREGDLNPVFTGCYTARISIKQRNRELENKLATVEKLQALEWAEEGTMPATLDAAWEPVLFNQFHDLICGSHLDPAYENTMQRFGQADRLAGAETAGGARKAGGARRYAR